MSTLFVSYLWHYLLARGIYDELVRPVAHGHPGVLVVVGVLVGGGFFVGRRSAPRSRR